MALSNVTVNVTVPPPTPVTVAVQEASDGKSAYQSYLDTTTDDPPMSEAEWSEGGADLTSYDQVSGLPDYPTSFPPAGHTHGWTDVDTNGLSYGVPVDSDWVPTKKNGGGSSFALFSQVWAWIVAKFAALTAGADRTSILDGLGLGTPGAVGLQILGAANAAAAELVLERYWLPVPATNISSTSYVTVASITIPAGYYRISFMLSGTVPSGGGGFGTQFTHAFFSSLGHGGSEWFGANQYQLQAFTGSPAGARTLATANATYNRNATGYFRTTQSGTFAVQAAKNNSAGGDTVVNTGSFVLLEKIQ